MLNMNYTTEFLNLEDVIITEVKNLAGQFHVYLEMPRREHICPCCGDRTDRVHDYRMQAIKDVPLGRATFLHLRKRRYRCACGKRFYEKTPFLPRYYRMTSRLIAEIIFAFQKLTSATDIGIRYNVSASTAIRYFQCVSLKPKELPEVLSLDEFKGNSGGHRYNSIVVDPKEKKILDILPNRYRSLGLIHFSSPLSITCSFFSLIFTLP